MTGQAARQGAAGQGAAGHDAGMLTARLAVAVGAAVLVIAALAAYAVTLPERLATVPAGVADVSGAPFISATALAPPSPAGPPAAPSPSVGPTPGVVIPPVPHPPVTAAPSPLASPKILPPTTPVPPAPVVSPPVVCPLASGTAGGPIVPGCPTCPPNAMCAAPPPSPVPVSIGDSANGSTLHVTVGTRIEVELGSTYWGFNPPSNPAVLEPTPHIGPLPMVMCPMIPGSGCGFAAQDYLAQAPGTSVISASRVSCGEALRCTGTAGDFSVTVVVAS
ncbi:MAG TPA: hypothetical protein VFW71_13165 [Actinomycetota bacterium]|nr:hypothetical protein [Actinomycetota bacterium]